MKFKFQNRKSPGISKEEHPFSLDRGNSDVDSKQRILNVRQSYDTENHLNSKKRLTMELNDTLVRNANNGINFVNIGFDES